MKRLVVIFASSLFFSSQYESEREWRVAASAVSFLMSKLLALANFTASHNANALSQKKQQKKADRLKLNLMMFLLITMTLFVQDSLVHRLWDQVGNL